MIRTRKELHIVLRSGRESKWKGRSTQARAELRTRVIFVKVVNMVIVRAGAAWRRLGTICSLSVERTPSRNESFRSAAIEWEQAAKVLGIVCDDKS